MKEINLIKAAGEDVKLAQAWLQDLARLGKRTEFEIQVKGTRMQALTGLFPGMLLTLKGHFTRSVRGGHQATLPR